MGMDPWEDLERERRELRKVRRACRRYHLESHILEALNWSRVLEARKTLEEAREAAGWVLMWLAQYPAMKRYFRDWLKNHPYWKEQGPTWALVTWNKSVQNNPSRAPGAAP